MPASGTRRASTPVRLPIQWTSRRALAQRGRDGEAPALGVAAVPPPAMTTADGLLRGAPRRAAGRGRGVALEPELDQAISSG